MKLVRHDMNVKRGLRCVRASIALVSCDARQRSVALGKFDRRNTISSHIIVRVQLESTVI